MKYISILFLTMLSCGLIRTGFTNEHNQYVPKKPKFKLKDKPGFVFPARLDTVNIYKLESIFYRNKQEYPYLKDDTRYGDPRYDLGIHYIKFYSKGRCLLFSIPRKNSLGMENNLNNKHLDPNNSNYSQGYYYAQDGSNIEIEQFVYAESDGRYVISKYKLENNGEILKMDQNETVETYVKQLIPSQWEKYNVTW